MENNKEKTINIEYCPICGSTPILEKRSLDYGNGYGYPDHYEYRIKCIACALPSVQSANTFHSSEHETMLHAIKKWNEQSKEITNKYLLKNSYLKKLIKEEK